jgi:hypothetical protein
VRRGFSFIGAGDDHLQLHIKPNLVQFRDDEKTYRGRADFIPMDSVDSFVLERDPDFVDYLFFHNVLDKFCWLLRLQYADRATVKRKRYRLDTLFQRFLLSARFNTNKAAKCQPDLDDDQLAKLEYHLTKGWLNELVRSDPLHPDMVQFGSNLQAWPGPGSGGLASWNVVQSYYAFYEFTSCIAASIRPDLDTRSHKAVGREFASHTLGAGKDRLLFYPFTLTSSTRKFPEHPAFTYYHYATYPREPGRGIGELEKEVQRALCLVGGRSRSSIFDLMYELRLWANYTGVASLMTLSDGGYQKFLMRNLGALIYFIAGMAELAYLAAAGLAKYLGGLKRFSLDYIDKHERFARHKYLIPSYVRLRSYKHLGILDEPLGFIIPEHMDPIEFIDV